MKGNRFSKIMVASVMLLFAVGAAPWPAAAEDELQTIFMRMRALSVAGDHDGALVEAQRYEAGMKARFGVNHPNYERALNALGIVYRHLGRYADAVAVQRQVLAMRERRRDDRAIAESLNNLAVVYEKEGKYAPAEELFKRSLALREKHPDSTDDYHISQ